MNNNFLLQALKFFDQEFRPKTCTCGIVVAFNTKMALQCVKDVFGAEVAQNITEEAIRSFIKSNGIGCTGKQVKFRMLSVGQQLRAVHVKRQWFEEETIVKLDRRKLCVTRKISLPKRLSLTSMAIYQSRGLLVCNNARCVVSFKC